MSKDKKDEGEVWSDYNKLEDWLPSIIVFVVTSTLAFVLPRKEMDDAIFWCIPCFLIAIFWGWYKGQDRRRKIAKNGEEDYKVFVIRFWFYLFMIFVPQLIFWLFVAPLQNEHIMAFWPTFYFFFILFGMQYIAKKMFPYSYDKEKDKKE